MSGSGGVDWTDVPSGFGRNTRQERSRPGVSALDWSSVATSRPPGGECAGACTCGATKQRRRDDGRRSRAAENLLCVVCDALRDLGLADAADVCDDILDCREEKPESEEEPPTSDPIDCVLDAVSVYPSGVEREWSRLSSRERDHELLAPRGSGIGVSYTPVRAPVLPTFEVEVGDASPVWQGTVAPIAVRPGEDPVNAAIPEACLGLSAELQAAFPFTSADWSAGLPKHPFDISWLTLRVNPKVGVELQNCGVPQVANADTDEAVFVVSGVLPYAIYDHTIDHTGLLKLRVWVGMVHFPSFYVTPNSTARPASLGDLPSDLFRDGAMDDDLRGEFTAAWMSLLGDMSARVAVRDAATSRPTEYIVSDAEYGCQESYASWWGGPTSACYAPSDAGAAGDVAVFMSNMAWGEVCFLDPELLELSRSPPPMHPLAPSPYAQRVSALAAVAFERLFGTNVVVSQTITFRTPASGHDETGRDKAVLRRWSLMALHLAYAGRFWEDVDNTVAWSDAASWLLNRQDARQFLGQPALPVDGRAGYPSALAEFSASVPCGCT